MFHVKHCSSNIRQRLFMQQKYCRLILSVARSSMYENFQPYKEELFNNADRIKLNELKLLLHAKKGPCIRPLSKLLLASGENSHLKSN